MSKVYIILGNDGFPRYADPEASKVYTEADEDKALAVAGRMAEDSPHVIFGVYELTANVFFDGQNVEVVRKDG